MKNLLNRDSLRNYIFSIVIETESHIVLESNKLVFIIIKSISKSVIIKLVVKLVFKLNSESISKINN